MTVTMADLVKMSQAELDEIYHNSPMGKIPNGDSQGTAIIAPDSPFTEGIASMVGWLAWQGKIFNQEQGFLFNKVTGFGIPSIKAQVYVGKSWLSDGDSIILDYSKTEIFLLQAIRDEIREVSPGIYLGNAYWDKVRVLNFALEF